MYNLMIYHKVNTSVISTQVKKMTPGPPEPALLIALSEHVPQNPVILFVFSKNL